MANETITVHRLGPEDAVMLASVAEGVFDNAVDMEQAERFLADECHEMVVAVAERQIVAMVSGVVLLHPDKRPQLFVCEVGTGDIWLRHGIGARLMDAMLKIASERGCEYVWVGTDADNVPARALYRKMGGQEIEGIVIYEWERAPS